MKKKKQTIFISILIVIFFILIILSIILNSYYFNVSDKPENNNSKVGANSKYGCNVSEGYTWNETDEACVRESEKSSRYYINNDPEFCKRIQFLCVEEKVPFYNKNGCGCELKSTTQN